MRLLRVMQARTRNYSVFLSGLCKIYLLLPPGLMIINEKVTIVGFWEEEGRLSTKIERLATMFRGSEVPEILKDFRKFM